MILVTVGSTRFPFFRMATLVKRLAEKTGREPIIFQHGPITFQVDPHDIGAAFIPHDTLLRYMKSARIIISHGGPATIYQCLSFGKRPWVLARERRYGEHVNDHQKRFTEFLQAHRLVKTITPATAISTILRNTRAIEPRKPRANTRMIRKLCAYTEESVRSHNA